MTGFGNPVTVSVTAQRKDRDGDRVTVALFDIPGCGFAPGSTDRDTSDTNTQITRTGTLYLPPDSPSIPPTAEMRFPARPGGVSQRWEVDGSVEQWVSPWDGWSPGNTIQVKRVTG